MHLALPRTDGVRSDHGLRDATAALVQAVAADWPQEQAPRVRLLPANVPFSALPPRDDDLAVSVGIGEQDLAPVRLDFAADPHLLLLGDARSGKTGFLRMLARRITTTHGPQQARIVLVDHRRGLLGEIPDTHLLGHGTDGTATRRLITEAAQGMRERAPGPGITPDQLRRRSWWQGPELFILVDDYDLVATQGGNPLLALVDLLPHSRDIGLHLIVARRTGGAGRALFEPVLQRLRELGTPGVLLSGAKDEGVLLGGVKPSPRPPGQGQYVGRRGDAAVIQLAWLPCG
jgi:S-DNA-T family DNA segregation ATPase FtsK/SpoIIIE